MSDLTAADSEAAFRRATERVRARLGFVAHAGVFLALSLALLVLDLVTTEGLWFYWPAGFWLLILAVHAAAVFGPGLRFVERWRDREYERELQRAASRRASAGGGPGAQQ